jgi:uncharacterized membrane protein YbhN (UPF0104 family)
MPRHLWRNLITLGVLIVLVVGVIAAVPGLHKVAVRLGHANAAWVVLAIALEVLSGTGYAIVFERVFERVPRSTARRVAWTEMAFGTVFPAGGAGGLALGGWILHERGAPLGRVAERSTVLFLLTSAINVIVAVVVSLVYATGALGGRHHLVLGLVPAGVGIAVAGAVLAMPWLVRRRGRQWRHRRLGAALDGLADAVQDTEQYLRRGVVGGAFAYLAFDIMVMWICFLAFGKSPGFGQLVLGYQIGYLSNALPIPGGIGILDGGLVGALVLYGVNATVAASAVLTYHVIWLFVPLAIGSVAFVVERRHLGEPLT